MGLQFTLSFSLFLPRIGDRKLKQLDKLEDYPKLYGRRLEEIAIDSEENEVVVVAVQGGERGGKC